MYHYHLNEINAYKHFPIGVTSAPLPELTVQGHATTDLSHERNADGSVCPVQGGGAIACWVNI